MPKRFSRRRRINSHPKQLNFESPNEPTDVLDEDEKHAEAESPEKSEPVLEANDSTGSVLVNPPPPTSTLPTSMCLPVTFGFKSGSDDLLSDLFSSISDSVCFCKSVVTPENVVTGSCGDMMCINCFLKGCPACAASAAATKSTGPPGVEVKDVMAEEYDLSFVESLPNELNVNGEKLMVELQVMKFLASN